MNQSQTMSMGDSDVRRKLYQGSSDSVKDTYNEVPCLIGAFCSFVLLPIVQTAV